MLVAMAPALVSANLLTNGDFESGDLSGWSVSGAMVTSSTVYAGDYAARFTGSASMDQALATVSGRAYKVVFWMRILSEFGSDWGGFSVSATDVQTWQPLGESPFITVADFGTNWFKFAFPFEAIGTASRLTLGYFGGPGRQMVVHADNIGVFDRTASTSSMKRLISTGTACSISTNGGREPTRFIPPITCASECNEGRGAHFPFSGPGAPIARSAFRAPTG